MRWAAGRVSDNSERPLSGLSETRPAAQTQQSETECGLTCLAMVLEYWGCATTLRELRNELTPGRDGLTALTIVRAARRRGLDVAGESAAPFALVSYSHPVILHWEESHFVVLERWDGRSGMVVDPAWGRRRITAEDLDSSFNGLVLNIRGRRRRRRFPGLGTVRGLRSLRHLADGLAWEMARVIVYMGLLQLAPLLSAALVKTSMDVVTVQREMPSMAVLWSAAIAFCLSFVMISAARALLMARLSAQLDYRLSDVFISRLMRLPLSYFHSRHAGDVMFRLGSLEKIRAMLSSTMVKVVFDVISLVVYCALVVVSPSIGTTLLVTIAVYVALIFLMWSAGCFSDTGRTKSPSVRKTPLTPNDGYLGVVCFACQAAHGQDDLLGVLAALDGVDAHLLGGQAQGTEEGGVRPPACLGGLPLPAIGHGLFDLRAGMGLGLPASPRALTHLEELAEPQEWRHSPQRGSPSRSSKGSAGPPPIFFHTRAFRCAWPNAWSRLGDLGPRTVPPW